MQKNITDYFDNWGLIVILDTKDGGDTCANEFTVMYCSIMSDIEPDRPLYKLEQLFSGQVPIRHPDKTKWYSEEQRTSRDQLRPLLYFLSVYRGAAAAYYRSKIVKACVKNYFLFAWNKYPNGYAWHSDLPKRKVDFLGPEIWATFIRMYRLWFLWPLLCIFDIATLLSSLHKQLCFFAYNNAYWGRPQLWFKIGLKYDPDQRNHALGSHFASKVLPTPISLINKVIYGTKLPRESFRLFWKIKPTEPPIDEYLKLLYK